MQILEIRELTKSIVLFQQNITQTNNVV